MTTSTSRGPVPTVYVTFSAEINATTAESLISLLAAQANNGVQEVCLLLSTPGGSVMNGMNLYNMLRAFPFRLTVHNVGNVDSIGNAVFLAGHTRYATPHSTFMFHGVASGVQAGQALDAKTIRELGEGLAADEKRISGVIRERTSLSDEEIVRLFQEQSTKDAAYALARGIIHEIRDVRIPPGSPVLSLAFQR